MSGCFYVPATINDRSGQIDPNGEVVFNISKETTSRELCDIEGIPESIFRAQNMLLSAGHVNAVEYCTNMFGFPQLTDLLDEFNKSSIVSTQ